MTREIVTFPDDAILTVEEVADYLRTGRTTAYDLVRDESFPSMKIKGHIRIGYWALKPWLAAEAGWTYPQPATEPVNIQQH